MGVPGSHRVLNNQYTTNTLVQLIRRHICTKCEPSMYSYSLARTNAILFVLAPRLKEIDEHGRHSTDILDFKNMLRSNLVSERDTAILSMDPYNAIVVVEVSNAACEVR